MGLTKKQCYLCKFSCVVVAIIVVALAVDYTQSGGSHYVATLKFVIVVTRHGTRGPTYNYPTDPYIQDKYWPDGFEGLTKIGKNQLHNLGKTLRQLYNGFLDAHFIPAEFQAFSSLVQRTMMSAQCLLAGLYPPQDYQLWNKEIPWQPIPVYPNSLDMQLIPTHPWMCPHFWKLQNESMQPATVYDNETVRVFQYLSKYSGLNVTFNNLQFIWDALSCEDYNDMKLPDWTKSIYPSPLEDIWNKQVMARVGKGHMVRLVAGPMIGSFIDSMKQKLNETADNKRKMLYYSSHDNTIKALLASFGFEDTPIINFAHTFMLELHTHPVLASGHEVKFFQIDGTSNDKSPREYFIPNCTQPCDFDEFIQLTKFYYEDLNWEKECEL